MNKSKYFFVLPLLLFTSPLEKINISTHGERNSMTFPHICSPHISSLTMFMSISQGFCVCDIPFLSKDKPSIEKGVLLVGVCLSSF